MQDVGGQEAEPLREAEERPSEPPTLPLMETPALPLMGTPIEARLASEGRGGDQEAVEEDTEVRHPRV